MICYSICRKSGSENGFKYCTIPDKTPAQGELLVPYFYISKEECNKDEKCYESEVEYSRTIPGLTTFNGNEILSIDERSQFCSAVGESSCLFCKG